MSAVELVLSIVAVSCGAVSLGAAVLASRYYGSVKKKMQDSEAQQCKVYKDRLEKWRARGYLVISDETWDELARVGKSHPEVYAHVYRSVRPHIRQLRAAETRKAQRAQVTLNTGKRDQRHGSRESEEDSKFRVEAPVPS